MDCEPRQREPRNPGKARAEGLDHLSHCPDLSPATSGITDRHGSKTSKIRISLRPADRAARGEPLWRVHSCVFAVLALESEPVDPRL
jgi:PNKP adenylyltransferase domain, ligase domain